MAKNTNSRPALAATNARSSSTTPGHDGRVLGVENRRASCGGPLVAHPERQVRIAPGFFVDGEECCFERLRRRGEVGESSFEVFALKMFDAKKLAAVQRLSQEEALPGSRQKLDERRGDIESENFGAGLDAFLDGDPSGGIAFHLAKALQLIGCE